MTRNLLVSDLYRSRARDLEMLGDHSISLANQAMYYQLAKIWDQLANLALEREKRECLAEAVEHLNTGKRYLTSIALTMISALPSLEELLAMTKIGIG